MASILLEATETQTVQFDDLVYIYRIYKLPIESPRHRESAGRLLGTSLNDNQLSPKGKLRPLSETECLICRILFTFSNILLPIGMYTTR